MPAPWGGVYADTLLLELKELAHTHSCVEKCGGRESFSQPPVFCVVGPSFGVLSLGGMCRVGIVVWRCRCRWRGSCMGRKKFYITNFVPYAVL